MVQQMFQTSAYIPDSKGGNLSHILKAFGCRELDHRWSVLLEQGLRKTNMCNTDFDRP